jgi:hypothetical protein
MEQVEIAPGNRQPSWELGGLSIRTGGRGDGLLALGRVAGVAAIIAAVRLFVRLFGLGHCAAAIRMPTQVRAVLFFRLVPAICILLMDFMVAVRLGVCVDVEKGHFSLLDRCRQDRVPSVDVQAELHPKRRESRAGLTRFLRLPGQGGQHGEIFAWGVLLKHARSAPDPGTLSA